MSKKLVFLTNILSHYQLSLSNEFIKILGDDYCFIATERFHEDMLKYGVPDLNQKDFVLRTYDSPESEREAMAIAEESDCLIVCGIPVDPDIALRRSQKGRITFEYSERPLKPIFRNRPVLELVRKIKRVVFSRFSPKHKYSLKRKLANSSVYLLCSGAFVSGDFELMGQYRGRAYKWGYFPETKYYDDIGAVISAKTPARILWAGRCIHWKQPELAAQLAERLRDENIPFSMKIIGSGEMQKPLMDFIAAKNLGNCVEIPGSMPPDGIRAEMEKAQIFLFTSNDHEGWGAVLNEAMNSGCAVVAGDKIGAVPYLIRNNYNGIIFRDKNIDDLTQKVKALLSEPSRMSELGRNAYDSIASEWSPRIAAERFMKLSEALSQGMKGDIFSEGPCSPAPVMRDNWFRE